MKKILVAFAWMTMLVSACKKVEKDVYNYFPKVKTISAEVQPDGSVRLTGHLTSTGAGEMNGIGFCMDTLPNPKMHYAQRICDTLFDDSFYATYSYLDATKPYYFRTWAVNEWGYVYGEDILVDDIKLSPSVIPCSVDSNTVAIEQSGISGISYISSMEFSSFGWEFEVYAGSHILRVRFVDEPVTGIWQITENTTASDGKFANILYTGPSTSGTYAKGGNIYVNQSGKGVFEITVCNTTLPIFSGDRSLKASFKVRY